jgi:hypothetical protein
MEGFGSATPGAHACLVVGKTNPRRIVRVTGFQGALPTMPNYRKSEGMSGVLRGGLGMECLRGAKSGATNPRADLLPQNCRILASG